MNKEPLSSRKERESVAYAIEQTIKGTQFEPQLTERQWAVIVEALRAPLSEQQQRPSEESVKSAKWIVDMQIWGRNEQVVAQEILRLALPAERKDV